MNPTTKVVAILCAAAACLGVIGIGVVTDLLGGPQRSVGPRPSAIQPALPAGDWTMLSNQEIVAIKGAQNLWEDAMGRLQMGSTVGIDTAITELETRIQDAKAELARQPLRAGDETERTNALEGLGAALTGLEEQRRAFQAGQLDVVKARIDTIRDSLNAAANALDPQRN